MEHYVDRYFIKDKQLFFINIILCKYIKYKGIVPIIDFWHNNNNYYYEQFSYTYIIILFTITEPSPDILCYAYVLLISMMDYYKITC